MKHEQSRPTVLSLVSLVSCLCPATPWAQSVTNSPVLLPPGTVPAVVRLPEVVVSGRNETLVGVADSATQGTVGAAQLAERPILRPGEVLETVPGVIVTQHSGSGKANQYFLRGFNLDHGTDFATSLDGVPVNLPTHAHGQGYTDLNFLIPELLQGVQYKKGPYYAEEGDFASAGAANLSYVERLPNTLVHAEGGSFGYARGVMASSSAVGAGQLLYAVELFHDDGPWVHGDNYRKFNGVLRYSRGDKALGYSLTALAYHGEWNSTDQVAQRAIDQGLIARFGDLDRTDGGNSQRYSISAEWHRQNDASATKALLYGFYYDLDLFSNFTYFLDDPVNGDQFHQHDRRAVQGLKLSHQLFNHWWGKDVENTFGLQVRNDLINNSLSSTVARQELTRTRADRVGQTSVAPYFENKVQWGEKLRTVAGARADLYHFDVTSDNLTNSGSKWDFLASPKGGIVLGPWAETEFYLNGGLGFHSNDGRGTTTRIDPKGTTVSPVNALVRTKGAEVGVRTGYIPGLQSSLSLWVLDIGSELLFTGDAGTTEPSRPSRRYGVEFANYYSPTKWLTFDADLSLSHSRFRDADPAGSQIPGSIASVVAAGVSVHDLRGFFGELRVRYFGPRALIEDNSQRSAATVLLTGRVGYEFNKTWKLAVEVFNLLDAKSSDIDYFYTSRLAGEAAAGVADRHTHPAEPRSLRVGLTARF